MEPHLGSYAFDGALQNASNLACKLLIDGSSKRKPRHHNEPGCHFMVGDNLVTLGPGEFWLGSPGPLVAEKA